MEKKIKIRIGKIEITAELNPARAADLIWDVLPIHSVFNFWGDEIYFPIPIKQSCPAGGVTPRYMNIGAGER
jgi:hypothetical protein